jgi:hypothetical protein
LCISQGYVAPDPKLQNVPTSSWISRIMFSTPVSWVSGATALPLRPPFVR